MSRSHWDIENQRDYDRVPYAAQLLVVCDMLAWHAEVQDLSEGGCGIFRPEQCSLEVGQIVRLFFFEQPGPALGVDARVARVEQRTLGFEYHEPQTVPPTRR